MFSPVSLFRSPSFSSTSNSRSEDSYGSRVQKPSQKNLRSQPASDRRPVPAVVDFHTAPAAFLPADFELKDARPASRRRRLANRAVGIEPSKEHATLVRPKRVRKLSTHIISLPRTDSSTRLAEKPTVHARDQATLHAPQLSKASEPCHPNEEQAENPTRGGGSRGETSSMSSSKKFFKSKSKIFKFWV